MTPPACLPTLKSTSSQTVPFNGGSTAFVILQRGIDSGDAEPSASLGVRLLDVAIVTVFAFLSFTSCLSLFKKSPERINRDKQDEQDKEQTCLVRFQIVENEQRCESPTCHYNAGYFQSSVSFS